VILSKVKVKQKKEEAEIGNEESSEKKEKNFLMEKIMPKCEQKVKNKNEKKVINWKFKKKKEVK
jgi:hypothetical protein